MVQVPETGLSSSPSIPLLAFGSVISPWMPGSDTWRAAWHQGSPCWEPLAVGTVLSACTETASSHVWKPWCKGSWVQAHFRLDWENYWVSLCFSIMEVMAKLRSSVFQHTHSYGSIHLQKIHTPCSYNQYTCPASADTHFRPPAPTAHSLCPCSWKRALLQAAGTQPQHVCHAQQ